MSEPDDRRQATLVRRVSSTVAEFLRGRVEARLIEFLLLELLIFCIFVITASVTSWLLKRPWLNPPLPIYRIILSHLQWIFLVVAYVYLFFDFFFDIDEKS